MSREFLSYVPLNHLKYSGDDLDIAPGVSIKRIRETPNLYGMDKHVSSDEWDTACSARYWLVLELNESDLSTSEAMNLVLLSIWLVKPNRITASLRFDIGTGDAEGQRTRSRLLDRFAWNSEEENEAFDQAQLESASNYYRALNNIYMSRVRLSNAMVLTLNGCWSNFWQAALISHAAAVEAMLTYSKGPGITKRLATFYACLVESESDKRDIAYGAFWRLYSARSDIMHGRVHDIEEENTLKLLAEFQSVLRTLWQTVLESNSAIAALEENDATRESFVTGIVNEYEPPRKNSR